MKKQPFQYSFMEIQSKHHNLTLDYRSQDRIIQSKVFNEAWLLAHEDERKYVLNLFLSPDARKLKKWVLSIVMEGLAQYPISVLRQLASYHQIKNYSRMTRVRLLEALATKDTTDGSKNSQ